MSTMKRVSVLMGGGGIAAAILAKMADVVAVSNSATNVTTTANAPKESRKERRARERAESKHRARYSK